MLKVRRRAAFAALVCVGVISACDDAPSEPQERAPVVNRNDPPPKVANLSGDMVAAVSAGRAANVISLHFALRATPTANTPLPVEVAIVPHRKFDSIRAHFESQDGLTAAAGDNFGPETGVEAESTLSHQLVLMPSREGMFMVTSSVETESEDGNVTRIFSIPVIVAPAAGTAPPAAPVNQPGKN